MAKLEKTPEEIADDNERTNSMGLFNLADAYWKSAVVLEKAKVKAGHSESPVRMLYYHAIELYLKALLRQYFSADTLSKKFGHNTTRMTKKVEEFGLSIMDEEREVFALMGNTDVVIRARYIRTGSSTFPTLKALNRTCKSLRESVGTKLHKAGIMVRLI